MNKILIPKFVGKFLTLLLLVGGLTSLLTGKTLIFDYPAFDSCMITAADRISQCYYGAGLTHIDCNNECNATGGSRNGVNYGLPGCLTFCDNQETGSRNTCETEYNSRIFGNPPPSTVPGLGPGYSDCFSISVPNWAVIHKRCRTQAAREFDRCLNNPAVGCYVNGKADINCCGNIEANTIQSCLYP